MSRVTFPNGDPRDKLNQLQKAVYSACVAAVSETVGVVERDAKRNLTNAGRVDRGILRGSIRSQTIGKATTVEGVVYVGAEHGPWVEYGRKGLKSSPPGTTNKSGKAAWPPIDVIRGWVARHAKILAPSGRTRSGRARPAKISDVESLAFLIARKIAMRGIKPTPFIGPAVDAARPRFNRRVRELTRLAIQSVTGKGTK